jgi:crotonobetainyl-CoA:carnitine CoA-transferase CaiB-like acyl-CoA transferase
MVWIQTNNIYYSLLLNRSRDRQLRTQPTNPLVNHYCCKDGRWILFAMFQPGKYWPAFCRVLGKEALVDDPRFKDLKLREQNSAELVSILDEVFSKRPRQEWLKLLSGEDLVYGPIQDYLEVVNDPQVLENEYITEYEHPSLGKLKEIGIPAKFGETPGRIREPAPQLGQHTEEVLIDFLGYSWEDIEKLRDQGIIL